MQKKSLFIAIEGLDGAGKTTVRERLLEVLKPEFKDKVLTTYEPNNPSAAGQYIRDILTKKITTFHPRVLAYAFATNRLDHNYRTILPWLEKEDGNIVITDRYYLSSLVYQSAPDFPFEKVMELNELARQPDIIFFLNVSNETCYKRMNKRNQPRELFEGNLTKSRNNFLEGIDFLRKTRNENVIEIDGNGTIEETLAQIIGKILEFDPFWAIAELPK